MTPDPTCYLLVDVFSTRAFGGNPLAVFPDAAAISPRLMQKLANELNLSETAFLCGELRPGVHKLRIFTPRSELPFAGHPSIGAAKVLQRLGRVGPSVVLQLPAGSVFVRFLDDEAVLAPPQPPVAIPTDVTRTAAAEMLRLNMVNVAAVAAYDAGIPYNLIELRSRRDVSAIRFNTAAWDEHLGESTNLDVYAFAIELDEGRALVTARMFAPADGIAEDPATGSAVAALAGYLRTKGISGKVDVTQGLEIGRPSFLRMNILPNDVEVAGSVVYMGRGTFDGVRC